MVPHEFQIEFMRGADFSMSLWAKDDNNAPIDLTNYEFKSQLREFHEATDFTEFTVTLIPAEGKISLYMSNENTKKIMYDRGVYDIMYTNTVTGIKDYLLRGNAIIYKSATR